MKKKIKIAILGYGSMGKEVEKAALSKNIEITDIFDIDKRINPKMKYAFDVAVDFTYPDAVYENVKLISKMRKNIVVGTTGWDNKKTSIKKIVDDAGIGLVYASNFSIGMQMFFRIVKEAAKMKNKFPDYDIFMNEIHHVRKKDSPSGTAITLAKSILDNVQSKKNIMTDRCENEIKPGQLHVGSIRGGEIPGTHTVYIDSPADTIELTHRAKSRTGFAYGAVEAAQWIHGKKGFHNFSDIFDKILK